MRSSVRINQPVHAEITVMNRLFKIPAIEVFFSPLFILSRINRMVAPFPHKSSAHPVILVNKLEIILKISRAVSHSVTVLHQKERLASIFLKILFNFLKRGVHSAVQIQIGIIIDLVVIPISGAFIMGNTLWIKVLCPF